MTNTLSTIAAIAFILVSTVSGDARASGESPITKRIEAAGPNPTFEPIDAADFRLQGIQSLPYEPLAATHRESPKGGFHVEARSSKLKNAPCDACHTEERLNAVRGPKPLPSALAHGTITIVHAPEERMACDTCHDFRKAMTPKTVTGVSLDFDRTYELCAGCHSSQYNDWRGGAHGKRLANWTGTRVVRACTGCHDPHRPAFNARTPATFAKPPSTWETLR